MRVSSISSVNYSVKTPVKKSVAQTPQEPVQNETAFRGKLTKQLTTAGAVCGAFAAVVGATIATGGASLVVAGLGAATGGGTMTAFSKLFGLDEKGNNSKK